MPPRQSVQLSDYPDMIVIMLGFRATSLRGLLSLFKIGSGLRSMAMKRPDGLLAHEQLLFGFNHVGIRQYWRDLDSMEAFTRSAPHAGWWRDFPKMGKGAGFWHETYSRSGAMEALYVNMEQPVGFGKFAPALNPVGPFRSARRRMAHTALKSSP